MHNKQDSITKNGAISAVAQEIGLNKICNREKNSSCTIKNDSIEWIIEKLLAVEQEILLNKKNIAQCWQILIIFDRCL